MIEQISRENGHNLTDFGLFEAESSQTLTYRIDHYRDPTGYRDTTR